MEPSTPRTAVLLPNGYGNLKYIHSLKNTLENEYEIFAHIPTIQGTGGDGKQLSMFSFCEDIEKCLSLTTLDKKVSIISHCSSIIALAKLGKSNPLWHSVNNVIIYSYLADPLSHIDRFIKKSEIYGSNPNISDVIPIIAQYKVETLSEIPVPIYVIHPSTTLNKKRAKASDLQALANLDNVKEIYTPNEGYEIEDNNQTILVKEVCKNFFSQII